MLTYRQNNIEFRIASASALAEFKKIQAHSFLQVCRKEIEFDHSAREVVLLSYDRFSHWLMRIERAFLMEETKYPTAFLKSLVYASFIEELGYIEELASTHPKIFNADIVAYVKVIHRYTRTMMGEILDCATKEQHTHAFVNVTCVISDYLQHMLIAMHEFNNNLIVGGEPFLCIGNFSLRPKQPKFIGVKARAEYFRERLGDVTFELKNYTDVDLNEGVIDMLSEMGVCCKPEELSPA